MKETLFRLKNQLINKRENKDYSNIEPLILDYISEWLLERSSNVTIDKTNNKINFNLVASQKEIEGGFGNVINLDMQIKINHKKIQKQDSQLYSSDTDELEIYISLLIPKIQFNTFLINLDILLNDDFDLWKTLIIRYKDMTREEIPTIYARI